MAHSKFALFQSHLDLAHAYWKKIVKAGDTVIDATCGNGHDTLILAQLALHGGGGNLYGFDIQPEALAHTAKQLESHLAKELLSKVHLIHLCHSNLAAVIPKENPPILIVYNLGYLPGGDKQKTTATKTTLHSIVEAEALVAPGGAISITCYPGHPEGKQEEEALMAHVGNLAPQSWSCCHHRWINRQSAPSLLLLQKQ